MVIFKDDFSGYCSIFFLKQKSESVEHFKFFVLRLEKEINSCVNVRMDEEPTMVENIPKVIFKNGSNLKEFGMKPIFQKHLNKTAYRNDKMGSLSNQLEE